MIVLLEMTTFSRGGTLRGFGGACVDRISFVMTRML